MSFRGPEGNSRREPITTAARVRSGVLVLDADGRWTLDTDARATPDGFVAVDADERATADATATEHDLDLLVIANRGTVI